MACTRNALKIFPEIEQGSGAGHFKHVGSAQSGEIEAGRFCERHQHEVLASYLAFSCCEISGLQP